MLKVLGVLVCLLLSSSLRAAEACEDNGAFRFICGFTAPEDLELAPDNETLLVGEMIPGGRLLALHAATLEVGALFPDHSRPGETRWGDPACSDYPTQMTFHGMDLAYRSDGALQLLVVNHGARESVEFFEVETDSGGSPRGLLWRGCVLSPASESLNDVAALPDGGFVTTTPFLGGEFWSMVRALIGINTGHVRRWRPDAGWQIITGTQSRYPNGVIARPDGSSFFVNLYIDGLVREYALDGSILGEAEVMNGDNLSWGSDGRIRIASHQVSLLEMVSALRSAPETNLSIAFSIVEYDPVSQQVRELLAHDGSAFGAATVAQEVNGKLFLGSFRGERVAVWPLVEE